MAVIGSPNGALQKTLEGRGRCPETADPPPTPMPDVVKNLLFQATNTDNTNDSIMNYVTDHNLLEFYLAYIHVLPENVIHIFEITIGQGKNPHWKAERQVCFHHSHVFIGSV